MAQMNYIKQIRRRENLTQEDLAEKCGTTQETIQRLESGKRRLTYDWIKRLADALGVHSSEITEGPTATIPRTSEEKEILETFRGLSESGQKLFGAMLRSLKDDTPSPPDGQME